MVRDSDNCQTSLSFLCLFQCYRLKRVEFSNHSYVYFRNEISNSTISLIKKDYHVSSLQKLFFCERMLIVIKKLYWNKDLIRRYVFLNFNHNIYFLTTNPENTLEFCFNIGWIFSLHRFKLIYIIIWFNKYLNSISIIRKYSKKDL